jgi:hypothetical protein
MTTNLPVLTTRDMLAQSLVHQVPIAVDLITADVIKYSEEAARALAVAERAQITDDKAAGNAADVIRAIIASSKRCDADAKQHVADLEAQATAITNFFKISKSVYLAAKVKLDEKVTLWRRAEEVKLIEENRKKREQTQAEAQRLAQVTAALGDAEGAQRIVEEAAAVVVAPARPIAVGVYGSTTSSAKRHIGKVEDRALFFAALAKSKDPLVVAIANKVEFPQALLNSLAKAVSDGDTITPAGFKADTATNNTYR